MLSFYSSHFDAVEINNTFYRMPAASVFEQWRAQVPEGFRFAIKAPQRITHQKRLAETTDDVSRLVEVSAVLGEFRGPILFQLPPYLRKNIELLRQFLGALPRGPEVAFEFRHESWFDDEVFGRLRAKSCALCVADSEDLPAPELVNTACWGMLRLRRETYPKPKLVEWLAKAKSQKWDTAYVFFKHEDSGTAPKFADQFLELLKS